MNKQDILLLPEQSVLGQLHSSSDGLSQREADERRATYGLNVLQKGKNIALRILGRQLKSSLIYLLVFASIFCFILQDFSDGVIIAVILLINTLLGFFQEYRSEKAVEKLSKILSKQVLVKRDGKLVLLDESLLVPGDVIHVEEGDIVPADCKLLETENLQVNESQLTGESVPVAKYVQSEKGKSVEDNNAFLLFTGSVIEKGEATAVVYATGNATELGKIASLSTSTRKVTQYEKSLQAFSSFLLKVVLITLVITFIIKLLITPDILHIPVLVQLVLFIIALAIAVVPEALPVIATVTLSAGASRLAKQNVIVKRLSSLEDLGNITLLCTDKTGTLTENKMSIQKVVSEDALLFQQFAYATLESLDEARKTGQNSYDMAFLAYIPPEIKERAKVFKQLQELPFDPDARRRRVVIENSLTNKHYLAVIGSAETLLNIAICPEKEQYLAEVVNDGKQGLRHLAIAYREVTYTDHFDILEHENNLTFLGFVTLVDPLRPSTKHTIELAEQMGVAIKILTGDSKEVAGYVASQIGLGGEVYTGEDLEKMSPEELRDKVMTCNVFARISPTQKFNIIQELKQDYVVGYQGDGINDAPALKLADVAIAVDSATDVAKENADIVLLKQDLEVIVNGIQYGRATFLNINKYLKYTMVGNFGNFFALAFLYLLSLDLPLLPVQLLLTSLITDIPLITIASDRVNTEEMLRPEKYDARSLMFISLILGSFTTFFELIFFALLKFRSPQLIQTSMFLYLTFIQLIVVVSVRNLDHFWRGKRPSWLLTIAISLAFLISLALPYLTIFEDLFRFTPLPPDVLAIILGLVVVYVFVLDTIKVWYYRIVERAAPSALL
jgi:P-type Mg2+ transporter